MNLNRWMNTFKNACSRGVFPHQLSFILDLPLRNLLLSPWKLADRLSLTISRRVLDIGAGSGFYSLEVAHRLPAGHLQLLDLQPEMLRKAKQKLKTEGLYNTGYTAADAGRLPFIDRCFDLVFLITVLGEIADQQSFLREAHRVLKSEGIFSITEYYPDPDFSPLVKVKPLVEKTGFELIQQYGWKWNYTVNFRKTEGTTYVA
jgi:uncharacterized protein